MPYGLKKETVARIHDVFSRYPQVNKAVLYGSRAKGNSKPGSDIDLTLIGDKLDLHLLNKISLDLDDLLLPYIFDLSILDQINNQDMLEHIQRVGQIFYEKEEKVADN